MDGERKTLKLFPTVYVVKRLVVLLLFILFPTPESSPSIRKGGGSLLSDLSFILQFFFFDLFVRMTVERFGIFGGGRKDGFVMKSFGFY